jgi:uncharacterized protein DUF4236
VGFRFRRSLRILPGIRLHIGKRGVSTSIGVRGAHVTLGHGSVRETVGLPGTGLSYTHVEGARKTAIKARGAEHTAAHVDGPMTGRPPGLLWPRLRILMLLAMLAISGRLLWLLANGIR